MRSPALFLAALLVAAFPLRPQTPGPGVYYPMFGLGTGHSDYSQYALPGCAVLNEPQSSSTDQTVTSSTFGAGSSLIRQGGWVPFTNSFSCPGASPCLLPGQKSQTSTSTLSASGNWSLSSRVEQVNQVGGTVTNDVTDTIQATLNFNSGYGFYHDDETSVAPPPPATNECTVTLISSETITGVLPITYIPSNLAPTTSAFYNPIADSLSNGGAVAVQVASATLSATAAAFAADGISAVPVAFQFASQNPVTLTVGPQGTLSAFQPDYLTNPNPGTGTTLTLPAPDHCTSDGSECVFIALVWPPNGLPSGAVNTTVTVIATQTGAKNQTATIQLQPPPVLLVHDLWSNPQASGFTANSGGLYDTLRAAYPHQLIEPLDYSFWNTKSFADPNIQSAMESAVVQLLKDSAALGLAARQVDIVGHGMGGLVARYFIDHPPTQTLLPKSPVHRLVTVATPHAGSAIAAQWIANKTAAPTNSVSGAIASAACTLESINPCTLAGFMAQFWNQPLDTGAQAIATGSSDLGGLSSSDSYSPIVGTYPPGSPSEFALNASINGFSGKRLTDLFTQSDDLVVQADSQGINSPQALVVSNVAHTALSTADNGELASPNVWNDVYNLLTGGAGPAKTNSPTIPTLTDISKYTQVPASDFSVYLLVNSSNVTSMNVGVPASIAIAATAASKKTVSQFILLPKTIVSGDPQIYTGQNTVNVTPLHAGTFDAVAVAVFSDSTYAVQGVSYKVSASTAKPVRINLTAPQGNNLKVGQSTPAEVTALYQTGWTDVGGSATLTGQASPSRVFSIGSGVVTGTASGVDLLNASFNGLTASTWISVGNCVYSLTPMNQLAPSAGGGLMVQLTTSPNCSWAVQSSASWLTVANPSGTGSAALLLTAAANTSNATQYAVLSVGSQQAVITQPATACTYQLASQQVTLPASSSHGSVNVTTKCPMVISSPASWLTALNLGSSVGYSADDNLGPSRTAAVLVGDQTITFTQAGALPPAPSIAAGAFQNAASAAANAIAPGEMVVLYGSNMGPTQLSSLALGSNGNVATQLSGTQVTFNGVPAPMVYSSAGQVAAIVPYEVTGTSAQIAVSYQGQASNPVTVPVVAAVPGIFSADSSGQGQAAAVNSNGTPNSPASPIGIGDVIELFMTGEGATNPPGVDGKLAAPPYPQPVLPVTATIGGVPAAVQYAGGAPGETAGLMQVNLQIPAGVAPGNAVPVIVTVGTTPSQSGVTIAVAGN